MSNHYPKVVKQSVNLGSLPYFSDVDATALRTVAFHDDHVVERFPRVLSLIRILDALEINLFLEHRYKGLFMPPKRGEERTPWAAYHSSRLNLSRIRCVYSYSGLKSIMSIGMKYML
ncbi:hypothetical protein [Brumicola pallidula]|uniref:hypothetical protein n=1 Tax=Brumicola pallidula TaxID=56807 RepID=UPI0012B64537|nr:hypothetical protein [Glaciecola pallidula]